MILEPVSTPEQALIVREDAAELYQALQRLPARHERALRLWYGIGCEPMIFRQIGVQLDVCCARAQQMVRAAERRLSKPLMLKFRERPGAQRMRRELDEARKAEASAQEFVIEQRIINRQRALEQRHIANIVADIEAERQRAEREAPAEAERQRQSTVAEILRIAEEVELELDQTPRQRKQRVVNPFGFSPERAAEYAAVLRGMMRA